MLSHGQLLNHVTDMIKGFLKSTFGDPFFVCALMCFSGCSSYDGYIMFQIAFSTELFFFAFILPKLNDTLNRNILPITLR